MISRFLSTSYAIELIDSFALPKDKRMRLQRPTENRTLYVKVALVAVWTVSFDDLGLFLNEQHSDIKVLYGQ